MLDEQLKIEGPLVSVDDCFEINLEDENSDIIEEIPS